MSICNFVLLPLSSRSLPPSLLGVASFVQRFLFMTWSFIILMCLRHAVLSDCQDSFWCSVFCCCSSYFRVVACVLFLLSHPVRWHFIRLSPSDCDSSGFLWLSVVCGHKTWPQNLHQVSGIFRTKNRQGTGRAVVVVGYKESVI